MGAFQYWGVAYIAIGCADGSVRVHGVDADGLPGAIVPQVCFDGAAWEEGGEVVLLMAMAVWDIPTLLPAYSAPAIPEGGYLPHMLLGFSKARCCAGKWAPWRTQSSPSRRWKRRRSRGPGAAGAAGGGTA